MKIIPLAMLLSLLTACAVFDASVPVENRMRSAQITLNAIEDMTPELVLSGDITTSDAIKMTKAINKAQAVIETAQRLAKEGLPVDMVEQLELAISALRVAQGEVESEKGQANIGRTIAILVIAKSTMLQTTEATK